MNTAFLVTIEYYNNINLYLKDEEDASTTKITLDPTQKARQRKENLKLLYEQPYGENPVSPSLAFL